VINPKTLLIGVLLATGVAADEGMWLFNQPPRERLQRDHGFDLRQEWLDHVMRSCVRFNNGGSGAFVSADGLVVTNHHIGSDSLQKLSKPGHDLLKTGYVGRAELPCADLELNVLQSIEDVTARVDASVKAGMTDEQASAARRAEISALEKSESERTGLRCEVVTLYLGGAYHLYRYKKYTDVRLVMAPEAQAAFFGGDADNFEYPRHNFDVCFFRVYENGTPLKSADYLRWNGQGVKSGDLVFVSGHPGRTNRLETMARLEHLRDHTLPFRLASLRSQEMGLRLYGQRGPEEKRQAQSELYSVANARKAYSGQYFGLLDHTLMGTKRAMEGAHRQAVGASPQWQAGAGKSWDAIATSQKQLESFESDYLLLEQRLALHSTLFEFARHLARWSEEKSKPNGERLREYRDSNLESLWQEVLSPAAVYPDLEVAQLVASLSFAAETLGSEHPLVQRLLQGKNPEVRANELVRGSRLGTLDTRRSWRDLSPEQLKAQGDPLLDLAFAIDQASRAARRRYDVEVAEPEGRAYAQIARSQFALQGKDFAPDATFSLRLAYGKVGGYAEPGRQVPHATTIGSLFAQATAQGNQDPYQLPQRWWQNRAKLDQTVGYNFVSTADTIGGNSGSPVLNRAGEVVGVNFDRNRYGLTRNFLYSDRQARHIAVHSPAVLHILDRVYGCRWLTEELRSGARSRPK
jgi:hypothetical protein